MELRCGKAQLHRLQLLRRNDDAHLLQLLQVQILRVELDPFELVRGDAVVVHGLQTLGVLRVVGQPAAATVLPRWPCPLRPSGNERPGILLREEALDESTHGRAVPQVEEGRFVGREREVVMALYCRPSCLSSETASTAPFCSL